MYVLKLGQINHKFQYSMTETGLGISIYLLKSYHVCTGFMS